MKRTTLTATLLLLLMTPLYANWGGAAGGNVATGTFKASGTDQVEMQDEDLNIQLGRDRARVRVDYLLKNTGAAVEVKAGFPCLGIASEGKSNLEVEDYQLEIDGKAVPYQTEKGEVESWKSIFERSDLRYPDMVDSKSRRLLWLTSRVHFAQGETHRVRVRYESLYEYNFGGASNNCHYENDYFRYLLATASAWKGPIRKGKVTIKAVSMDARSLTVKPDKRFVSTPEGLVWKFTDLSPSLDDTISICFNNQFFTQMLDRSRTEPRNWYSFEGRRGEDDWSRYFLNFQNFSASASSARKDYPATYVGDRSEDTAWVAGRNGGIGESVTLTLSKPTHVDQLAIIPGYSKSKALYSANNRLREVEVTVNGSHRVRATLLDDYAAPQPWTHKGHQLIDLGNYAGEARTIKVTVRQVYPGAKYNDTCVSDIFLRKRLAQKPTLRPNR